MSRVLACRVADLLVGLDVAAVSEVRSPAGVVPVPGSPPGVAGIANVRGRILTVLDLCARLAPHAHPQSAGGMHVVVGSGAGRLVLRVDEVLDAVATDEMPPGDLPDTIGSGIRAVVRDAYRKDDELLVVLELAAVTDLSRGWET